MAVKIRQVWKDVKIDVTNPFTQALALYITANVNGKLSPLTQLTPVLQPGASYSVTVPKPTYWNVGDTIQARIMGKDRPELVEWSNTIIYKTMVVPALATGLMGLTVGAVAGYFIRPKQPLVPILVGAGLGAGAGYGIGYVVAKS